MQTKNDVDEEHNRVVRIGLSEGYRCRPRTMWMKNITGLGCVEATGKARDRNYIYISFIRTIQYLTISVHYYNRVQSVCSAIKLAAIDHIQPSNGWKLTTNDLSE